jgi:superoxide dismutase, Fe-Mn family
MFTLPKLPYAEDALEPHVSAETMALHHGKHHKAYVDKLNELLVGDPLADVPLEDVIRKSHGLAARQHIFDNAAQCWNHEFFWKSMTPGGGGAPGGAIKDMISRDIGDKKDFSEAFVKAASDHFGSGWIWLVLNGDSVEIMTTHDADLPLVHGRIALVTCDLWEHAYYLDYQNKRPAFVEAFLDHLIDWDFANANLGSATAGMAKAA